MSTYLEPARNGLALKNRPSTSTISGKKINITSSAKISRLPMTSSRISPQTGRRK